MLSYETWEIFKKTHLDYHFSKNHETLFKTLMAVIVRWFLNLIIFFILDSGIKNWTCEFINVRKNLLLVSLFLNKIMISYKSSYFQETFCFNLLHYFKLGSIQKLHHSRRARLGWTENLMSLTQSAHFFKILNFFFSVSHEALILLQWNKNTKKRLVTSKIAILPYSKNYNSTILPRWHV